MSDQNLAFQFKEIFSQITHAKEIILQWLLQHKDYTSSMWETLDETGSHIYHSYIRDRRHVVFSPHIFSTWMKECENLPHLYNQANDSNKVLFHDMFDLYQKEIKSYEMAMHLSAVRDVMEKTDPALWTHWDQPQDAPGSRLAQMLLTIIAQKEHEPKPQAIAREMLALVNTHHSKALSSSANQKSPWLNVSTAQQMQSLLDSGCSFNDEVDGGAGPTPAWKWLTHKWVAVAQKGKKDQAVSFLMENNDEDVRSHIQKLIDTNHYWSRHVPSDRRASVGYVKKIIEETNRDNLGYNSLDYLAKHRRDLFDLLLQKMYHLPKERAQELLENKDEQGRSLIVRLLIKKDLSLTSYQSLLDLHKHFNIDPDVHFEGGFLSAVVSPLEKLNRNSWSYMPHAEVVAAVYKNGIDVFGGAEQQEKWEDMLEKNWPMIYKKTLHPPDYHQRNRENVDDKVMIELAQFQAHVILQNPNFRADLSPVLRSHLDVLGLVWMNKNYNGQPNNTTTPLFGRVVTTPPEVFTPALVEIVNKPDFKFTMSKYMYSRSASDEKEAKDLWLASVDRFNIQSQLDDIHENTNVLRVNRKM